MNQVKQKSFFLLAVILISWSFIFPQKAPYLDKPPIAQQNNEVSGKPHPDYSPYFNDILEKVRTDVNKLVNKGFIDGRIAIVEFKAHPYFYESERSYVLTGLELLKFNVKRGTYKGGLYVDKKEPSFVRSLKALSLRAYQVADQIVLEKGLKSEEQLKNFAKKIDGKYYAKVHLNRTKNAFELTVIIQEVKSKQKIYQKKIVAATKLFSHYFGLDFSIDLNRSTFNSIGVSYTSKIGLGQWFGIAVFTGTHYSFLRSFVEAPVGLELSFNIIRAFTDKLIDKFNTDLFIRGGAQFGYGLTSSQLTGTYFGQGGLRLSLANHFFLSLSMQAFTNTDLIFSTSFGGHF